MLTAFSEYATKWRFEPNDDKSKVVVIANKRLMEAARLRNWVCGSVSFQVVTEYKYLGAEMGKIGRGRWNSLLSRLWNKTRGSSNLIAWMSGGKSGLRPRTSLHVWHTLARPKSEYACELWEGEISQAWSDKLESLQTSFARTILNTRQTAPSCAVRKEANLQPLHIRRQERRLNFWAKLHRSPASSLLNLVFRRRHAEVSAGAGNLSWLKTTKKLLTDWSLHHYWVGIPDSESECWSDTVSKQASVMEAAYADTEAAKRPSLATFNHLKPKLLKNIPLYLDDRRNITGTWLKTQLRMNTLLLMQRNAKLAGLPPAAGSCLLCRSAPETVEHFLQQCPALSDIRNTLSTTFEELLPTLGASGRQALSRYRQGGDPQLHVLLGDTSFFAPDAPEEERAKVAQSVDRVAKSFFVHCWKFRTARIGQPRLTYCSRSGQWAITESASIPVTPSSSTTFVSPVRVSDDWRSWVERAPRFDWSHHKRTLRKKFFAVASGPHPGVFYTWRDTWEAIKADDSPLFKGFQTMAEAYAWLKRNITN
jgi:hypothetical protein